jgi:hypothetical protein
MLRIVETEQALESLTPLEFVRRARRRLRLRRRLLGRRLLLGPRRGWRCWEGWHPLTTFVYDTFFVLAFAFVLVTSNSRFSFSINL